MPDWYGGFPYFLQFSSKELMIWVTVSSQSCFCWLYRASQSLAAKNTINLISVLIIWWCPYVESPLVLLEEGGCYDQCVLLAELLLTFALLHIVLQGQIFLLLQVFLDFLLLHDRMWSTGEGNGKPLQYSCLEYPMNSMKKQKDRTLKDELARLVDAQYATGDQWRNNSRKNEGMETKQK